MTRNDILAPNTWRTLEEENFDDGISMVLGYSQGIIDVVNFVKNLPKDLTAEEFKAQILDLCSRGDALTEDIANKLGATPSWMKSNLEQK